MLKHIVLLKFKKDLSSDSIQSIMMALSDLRKTIPEIISFTYGSNNSPEGLNRGYDYGFTMEFATSIARDHYLKHPDHIRVVTDFILPALEEGVHSTLVFDYSY